MIGITPHIGQYPFAISSIFLPFLLFYGIALAIRLFYRWKNPNDKCGLNSNYSSCLCNKNLKAHRTKKALRFCHDRL